MCQCICTRNFFVALSIRVCSFLFMTALGFRTFPVVQCLGSCVQLHPGGFGHAVTPGRGLKSSPCVGKVRANPLRIPTDVEHERGGKVLRIPCHRIRAKRFPSPVITPGSRVQTHFRAREFCVWYGPLMSIHWPSC